jgi:protein involved in polysaccharide export with SLBB domain
LKARVGLASLPDTAVEVVQFRPFYVVGKVERPGEYAYRPGLNVLQAISVAGGFYRPADPGLMRLDRDAISSQGSVSSLLIEADQFITRRARLRAELDGKDVIPFPKELSRPENDPTAVALMQQEQLLLKARLESLKSQTDALQELKVLLTNEVQSLNARVELKDRQLLLLRKELTNVGSLVSRGLAVAPRQFSLERAEADIETSRLELDTALLRARQDISRSDRQLIELKSQRRNEVLNDLRSVEGSLEQTRQKLETARRLVAESDTFAARFGSGGSSERDTRPTFSIVRGSGDAAAESLVSEVAPVLPGDIIRVDVKPSRPEASLSGGDASDRLGVGTNSSNSGKELGAPQNPDPAPSARS